MDLQRFTKSQLEPIEHDVNWCYYVQLNRKGGEKCHIAIIVVLKSMLMRSFVKRAAIKYELRNLNRRHLKMSLRL